MEAPNLGDAGGRLASKSTQVLVRIEAESWRREINRFRIFLGDKPLKSPKTAK